MTAAVRATDAAQRALIASGELNLEALCAVADGFLADLAADRDLFAGLALSPPGGDGPAEHGVHAAMTAAALGAAAGLDRAALRDLCVGLLIHDAGMHAVDGGLWGGRAALDAAAFERVAAHPIHTFAKLPEARALPARAAFTAYQVHERNDGSGYPRGRTAGRIHPLAKLAAVADVLAALVAPRPHRPALAPHHAVAAVLREAAAGRLDPAAAKALLRVAGLYPVGSRVRLDDGRTARVLRAGLDPRRPVVELESAEPGGEAAVLPLADHPGRRIAGLEAG